MKVLVTGVSGFVGGNLARELLRQGYQVKGFLRPQSDRRNLAGLAVEPAYGDLRDAESVERAMDGCDCVFHVAAAYTLWSRDPRSVYATNVEGTRNVLKAALAKGIRKVVYTSTESTIAGGEDGCLAESKDHKGKYVPAGDYKRSKYQAEQVAMDLGRQGLPVVVVNPTTPIGPGDLKPTPTGQIIVDFLNGRMPAYVNTGLNLIYVEDVVKGHILAMEKGRAGERYVLGCRNVTFQDMLGMLEQITGLKAPSLRIPIWLALGVAYVDEFAAKNLLERTPRVPVAGVKTARRFRFFDCSKAVQELGLPQTPIEEALEKSVRWFRENGYAR
ncbi:MAG: hopanoid-associated sugar epimerase [Chloroflexota bacterium]